MEFSGSTSYGSRSARTSRTPEFSPEIDAVVAGVVGEGRIRRDGAESLNIQTRRISFFILLVLFVQRKEKRKAATPPAGWMTATRPRVVQPLRRVRMRTYHQVIHSSPLFSYFPSIWSSLAMFFSCRNPHSQCYLVDLMRIA